MNVIRLVLLLLQYAYYTPESNYMYGFGSYTNHIGGNGY